MYPVGRVLTPISGIPVLTCLPPVPGLQKICYALLKPVLYSLIIVLLGTGFVVAAEIDDSILFIEAFSAHQTKDCRLTIKRVGIINQLFPDTPLRD